MTEEERRKKRKLEQEARKRLNSQSVKGGSFPQPLTIADINRADGVSENSTLRIKPEGKKRSITGAAKLNDNKPVLPAVELSGLQGKKQRYTGLQPSEQIKGYPYVPEGVQRFAGDFSRDFKSGLNIPQKVKSITVDPTNRMAKGLYDAGKDLIPPEQAEGYPYLPRGARLIGNLLGGDMPAGPAAAIYQASKSVSGANPLFSNETTVKRPGLGDARTPSSGARGLPPDVTDELDVTAGLDRGQPGPRSGSTFSSPADALDIASLLAPVTDKTSTKPQPDVTAELDVTPGLNQGSKKTNPAPDKNPRKMLNQPPPQAQPVTKKAVDPYANMFGPGEWQKTLFNPDGKGSTTYTKFRDAMGNPSLDENGIPFVRESISGAGGNLTWDQFKNSSALEKEAMAQAGQTERRDLIEAGANSRAKLNQGDLQDDLTKTFLEGLVKARHSTDTSPEDKAAIDEEIRNIMGGQQQLDADIDLVIQASGKDEAAIEAQKIISGWNQQRRARIEQILKSKLPKQKVV